MFCCTQPLRSTARYARGEVIEINDFLLGTMAGGAADCSLIGSQSLVSVGWNSRVLNPLGLAPKVFRNLSLFDPPYLERLLRDAKKMSRLRSGFGSAT